MIFRIAIERSRETVFEHVRNLAGYKAWLPPSQLFVETVDISDDPVAVGTTYVDQGTAMPMSGEVTALEPPRLIAFRQAQNMKRGLLSGRLTVTIRYTLEAISARETLVTREQSVQTTGTLLLVRPLLMSAIRKENQRIMQRMKEYLEARVK